MFCRFGISLGFPDIDTPQFLNLVGDRDPVRQLEYAADVGFSGADDPFLMRRAPAEQSRIGEALARLGLEAGGLVLAPGDTRLPLWGRDDEASREEIGRRLAAAGEAAGRANGRHVTLITGRDADRPLSDQRAVMADNLKRVIPELERRNIVLCLEPTAEARISGLLLNGLDEALEVVQAVDSPHVRLLFDTLHIQLAHGDLIANLTRAFPWIDTVQIADNPGRLEPGSGEVNFVNVIVALLGLGHEGLICLEHTNTVPGAEGERLALDRLVAIDEAVRTAVSATGR
jgi:hydroxypyruvate isomerase